MARKLFNTQKATHEEWLEQRTHSIGGSEAGTCVNMNSYDSLISLYSRKKGLVKDVEDNEAMRLGRDLEQYVADRFMEVTGKKLVNDNFFYLDDEYDFISANVDRRVVGENAGFEAKTMSSFNGYNIEAGEIPAHYFCQCQHYCMVRGWDYIYIGILVLQRGFYWHKIDRDERFIKDLREQEVYFWTHYIEQDIMPEPDGSDASLDTIKELYPDATPHSEIAIPGLDSLIRDYKAYGELEKQYKEKKATAQAQICKRLGDNEVGVGTNFGCSWKKQSKTTGYDMERLKKDHPEIDIDKYKKVSEYRVFRTRNLERKGA